MERTRRRVLREEDVLDVLNDSEAEAFIPSDEDLDDCDPTFTLQSSYSSDSKTSDEEIALGSRLQQPPSTITRGASGGRSLSGRRCRNILPSAIEDPSCSETSDDEITARVSSGIQRLPSTGTRVASRGRGIRGRHSRNILPSTNSAPLWSQKEFPPKELQLTEPTYLPNNSENFEKTTYFAQYVDDKFMMLVVEKTNQTFVKLHGRSMNLDVHELYVYIGITFIMASVNYPWLRMYWESRWRVAVIADHMSRNRFLQIRNSVKVVFDDDINQEQRAEDKLWKVRPLITKIQEGCRAQEKYKNMSLDEMIVPFTGSCGIKQYCPGKPNPVGMKAFVLANPNGLVIDFHIYQGSTTYKDLEDSNFGLGEKAVLTLVESLVPGHILYFDRYFTSEKLANELLNRGIGCTGTIMKNRVPAAARPMLKDDKELQRSGRGSVHTIVRDDNQIAITKWYDNKPVILLSTVEAKETIDVCQRWCKRQKRYISVDRPRVVRNYNENMGGVDLADRMLAVCPNRYRTKKWTQRFFSHMLDLAVSNSWLQFKKDEIKKGVPQKKIQQLRFFKMDLGEKLIVVHTDEETISSGSEPEESVPAKRKRGKPTTLLPSKEKRQQGAKHMPLYEEKQARCRQCHYNKSRTKCSTCNVSLCLTKHRNCYKEFHE